MKKTLIIVTALVLSTSLAACGFKPMHTAAKLAEAPAFNSIKVELVDPDRVTQKEAGYHLQQHLFNRLGQNSGPHILRLDPTAGRRPYGLTTNDVASRFDMSLRVKYQLINSVDGKTLDKGEIRAVTTFGASRDVYGRIAAQQNAAEQVARDAADRILVRLAAYYNNNPSSNNPGP